MNISKPNSELLISFHILDITQYNGITCNFCRTFHVITLFDVDVDDDINGKIEAAGSRWRTFEREESRFSLRLIYSIFFSFAVSADLNY